MNTKLFYVLLFLFSKIVNQGLNRCHGYRRWCFNNNFPVCGYYYDGSSRTYENVCSACNDSLVRRWSVGVCRNSAIFNNWGNNSRNFRGRDNNWGNNNNWPIPGNNSPIPGNYGPIGDNGALGGNLDTRNQSNELNRFGTQRETPQVEVIQEQLTYHQNQNQQLQDRNQNINDQVNPKSLQQSTELPKGEVVILTKKLYNKRMGVPE
jgi:hypothetical protein